MRILPYRTTDNAIAGVVITFIDISEQEKMKEALSFAEEVFDTLFQPVLVLNKELRIISANKAFLDDFEISRKDIEQKLLYEIDDCAWNLPEFKEQLQSLLTLNSELHDYTAECHFSRIGKRKLRFNARPFANQDPMHILMTIDDITGGG
jgi:two-component system CheB/CheR fusion protein